MSRYTLKAAILVIVSSFPLVASGQQGDQPKTLISLNIHDVVGVNPIQPGASTVTFTRTNIVTEVRTRTLTYTVNRPQQRTSTVIQNGQQVEKSYTVFVPVTEERQVSYEVYVPVGLHEKVVPLETLTGWDKSGRQLSADELARRLSTSTAAFLFPEPWPEGTRLDDLQSAVVKDDVLILFAPDIQEEPAVPAEAPAVEAPVAPAPPAQPAPAAAPAPPAP